MNVYTLLACHMIGDYVLQSDFLAKTKGDNLWHLIVHCVTYTIPFAIVFGFDMRIIWLIIMHIIIDYAKAKLKVLDYATDQVLHILALFVYVI